MAKKKFPKIELLAPAGSPEKMAYAFQYGADAVYLGIPDFSMRARINQFDEKNLAAAVKQAHRLNKKIYVTLNIYAHQRHLAPVVKHLKFLRKIKPDAIILSDPGILNLVKKYYPESEIHLSTQANATNAEAVRFWASQGIKRIILAREVSLSETKEIHQANPEVELEYFVHGAMCMSYSGRCILSQWMKGRSANLGDCVQACRWRYAQNSQCQIPNAKSNPKFECSKNKSLIMTVEDDKGEFEIDLEEDQNGTYFFNSRDLNLLSHLEELQKAGVTSFKIEGRNKSVFYLAVVVRAYRKVIQELKAKSTKLKIRAIIKEQQKELSSLMHRGYTTGFLLKEAQQNFSGSHKYPKFQFVGEVLENQKGMLKTKIHNALLPGDRVEAVTPEKNIALKIIKLYNQKKKEVLSAHGGHNQFYYLKTNQSGIASGSLLRRKV